jgi:hypothetical protein
MAGPVYICQDDLEDRYGARRVLDTFSDDGRNMTPRLGQACRVASRKVESILGSGWSFEQIATLIKEDEAILACVCDLAMADGIESGRPEWAAVDNPPFARADKNARALLLQYANGELDSRGEAKAGANPHKRVGKVRTRKILFAPTKDRPQRGGY